MRQQGQVFALKSTDAVGPPQWAYRYRLDGRDSRRIQCGGFTSEQEAREALERELDVVRRKHRSRALTLDDLVHEYLDQHDAQPETTAKLRWLLAKATSRFGSLLLSELEPREIAAWRMTIPPGHRFEATQALRQTLARAVDWGLLEVNPAKVGVDNPLPPRREMLPFESREQLETLAAALGPQYGPMVRFAAATGMRPGEWLALEWRDIDRDARQVHVRRAFRASRVKTTKTDHPRAVPLHRSALDALDSLPRSPREPTALLFPAHEGGYLDLHNWRPRHWRPAHGQAGISPVRRVYDLRHTFATFALHAGVGTFELSRYMSTSLVNIDRTYGHLTRDGHHRALALLDGGVDARGRFVDAVASATTAETGSETAS
jgi:integrase